MDSVRPLYLVDNEHYTLVAEPLRLLLRLTRSAQPFTSALSVNRSCEPVQEALDQAGRARYSLLIDSRKAPSRNDPSYEAWFESHRERMIVGMKRVGILMRSAVGKLHAERLLRDSDRPLNNVRIFVDEEAALEFLVRL